MTEGGLRIKVLIVMAVKIRNAMPTAFRAPGMTPVGNGWAALVADRES